VCRLLKFSFFRFYLRRFNSVEVVLSERLADGQRRVVTRKQLPYYFDVYSRRVAEKASDLEIGASTSYATLTS